MRVLGRAAGKPEAEPGDAEAAAHRLEQDLLEMQLGASRLGMRGVAEVDREQVERRRHRFSPTVPITWQV